MPVADWRKLHGNTGRSQLTPQRDPRQHVEQEEQLRSPRDGDRAREHERGEEAPTIRQATATSSAPSEGRCGERARARPDVENEGTHGGRGWRPPRGGSNGRARCRPGHQPVGPGSQRLVRVSSPCSRANVRRTDGTVPRSWNPICTRSTPTRWQSVQRNPPSGCRTGLCLPRQRHRSLDPIPPST